MWRSVAVVWLLVIRTASADVYAGTSVIGGARHYRGTSQYGAEKESTDALIGVRVSLGAAYGKPKSIEVRIGLAAEVATAAEAGPALGIETMFDWPISSCWRFGPRLALGGYNGGGGPFASAGVVARNGGLVLGVDVVGGRPGIWFPSSGYDPVDSVGVVARVGMEGRGGVAHGLLGGVGIFIVLAFTVSQAWDSARF